MDTWVVWIETIDKATDQERGLPDLDWLDFDDLATLKDELVEELHALQPGQEMVLSLLPGLIEPSSDHGRVYTHGTAVPPPCSVPGAFGALVSAIDRWDVVYRFEADSAAPGVNTPTKAVRVWVGPGAQDHLMRLIPAPQRPRCHGQVGRFDLWLTVGDLSQQRADALVNASNTQLKLGAGVSGALARVGGPELQRQMQAYRQRHGELQPGDVAVTPATGRLACQVVLHAATVSGTALVVKQGLRNVLRICSKRSLATVALPALGTGVGGLEMATCAQLLRQVLLDAGPMTHPRRLICVLWTLSAYQCFKTVVLRHNHTP
ncbi:MAG: macro domain-containing protein [Myxococcota bacterium]